MSQYLACCYTTQPPTLAILFALIESVNSKTVKIQRETRTRTKHNTVQRPKNNTTLRLLSKSKNCSSKNKNWVEKKLIIITEYWIICNSAGTFIFVSNIGFITVFSQVSETAATQ